MNIQNVDVPAGFCDNHFGSNMMNDPQILIVSSALDHRAQRCRSVLLVMSVWGDDGLKWATCWAAWWTACCCSYGSSGHHSGLAIREAGLCFSWIKKRTFQFLCSNYKKGLWTLNFNLIPMIIAKHAGCGKTHFVGEENSFDWAEVKYAFPDEDPLLYCTATAAAVLTRGRCKCSSSAILTLFSLSLCSSETRKSFSCCFCVFHQTVLKVKFLSQNIIYCGDRAWERWCPWEEGPPRENGWGAPGRGR